MILVAIYFGVKVANIYPPLATSELQAHRYSVTGLILRSNNELPANGISEVTGKLGDTLHKGTRLATEVVGRQRRATTIVTLQPYQTMTTTPPRNTPQGE